MVSPTQKGLRGAIYPVWKANVYLRYKIKKMQDINVHTHSIINIMLHLQIYIYIGILIKNNYYCIRSRDNINNILSCEQPPICIDTYFVKKIIKLLYGTVLTKSNCLQLYRFFSH